jgi:hypothetical protein
MNFRTAFFSAVAGRGAASDIPVRRLTGLGQQGEEGKGQVAVDVHERHGDVCATRSGAFPSCIWPKARVQRLGVAVSSLLFHRRWAGWYR